MLDSRVLGLSRDNRLIALSLLLWGLGSGTYFYVWPIYVNSLGAGPYEVGLLLALGGGSAIAGFVVGGLIEPRFNWRSIMLAGWVVGTTAALLYGLATSWLALIPGVFLLNFSGFCDPAFSGYIAAASEGKVVGRTFTTVFAGFSLGMAVSPAVGGWLSGEVGVRTLFFVSFALYSLSTLTLLRIGPRRHHAAKSDEPHFLQGQGVPFVAPLRDRHFRQLVTLLLLLFTTSFIGTSLLPLYFEQQAGLSTGVVGGLGTITSLGGVAISLALGSWSDRAGINRALAATSLFLVGCFALALLAPAVATFDSTLLYLTSALAYALRGGMTAQTSLGRASVLKVLQPPIAGRGFAIQMISLGAAQTAGPFLAGILYAQDPRLPLAVAIVSGVIIALFLARRPLSAAEPEPATTGVFQTPLTG